MHIAIVGNIGAGKTTLTDLLAKHLGYEPKFEVVDTNPYLEDFYKDMERWSFNLQIYFLNSRFKHVRDIKKNKNDIVQDRTIYEDHLFARNLYQMGLMAPRDYNNYKSIFDSLTDALQPPNLIIYLKASLPTLFANIKKRERDYEANIDLNYLSKLNERYEDWISRYTQGSLLTLDKDTLDFVNRPEDLRQIFQQVEQEILSLSEK